MSRQDTSLPLSKLTQLKTLTESGFEQEVLAQDDNYLVLFWSPWSKDCSPFMQELDTHIARYRERAPQVQIGSLNIEENTMLSIQYNIRTIPTLVHFQGGAIQTMHERYLSKRELDEMLQTLWPPSDEDEPA